MIVGGIHGYDGPEGAQRKGEGVWVVVAKDVGRETGLVGESRVQSSAAGRMQAAPQPAH